MIKQPYATVEAYGQVLFIFDSACFIDMSSRQCDEFTEAAILREDTKLRGIARSRSHTTGRLTLAQEILGNSAQLQLRRCAYSRIAIQRSMNDTSG